MSGWGFSVVVVVVGGGGGGFLVVGGVVLLVVVCVGLEAEEEGWRGRSGWRDAMAAQVADPKTKGR